jgi:heavy metal efflux system protein
VQQLLTDYEIISLRNKITEYEREELKLREGIEYYNTSGKLLYDEILRTALKSFQSGEIDLFKFTSSYEIAVQIKLNYLDNVLQYNTNILEQTYLSN